MENKNTFITLLMDAAKGYMFTLELRNYPSPTI